MAQKLVINADNVEDLLTGYGAGSRIEIERSATGGGTGFTQIATVPLVAGTGQYEYWDTTGSGSDFYRTRYTTSAGAIPSAWSAEFRAGSEDTYASLDDLRETLDLPDHSRDNFLLDCLRRASGWITAECGRDFYRHPSVTGTEVRTYNVNHATSGIDDDIVSISLVEYATATGAAYTSLGSSDWYLIPSDIDGVPFGQVALSDVGALRLFARGYATVRLTGVFGYASPPVLVEQATLDLARELYQQGPGGRPVGVDYGRLPLSVQRAINRHAPFGGLGFA